MTDVAMTRLNSSHVVAVGYDEDTGALVVEYKGGKRYTWADVSREDYEGLIAASSPGGYLRHEIESRYGNGSPA